jgi:two-component system response regulator
MNHINPIEILIIEDNAEDALLALRALSRNRVANRIQVFEEGPEALDFLFHRGKFASHAGQALPRVVFLDLKLPKMNGLEILAEIRANEATRTLPVVIVTSSKENPDIRKAYDLGANSYVVKPVDFEAFSKAIADLGMYWLVLNEPPA